VIWYQDAVTRIDAPLAQDCEGTQKYGVEEVRGYRARMTDLDSLVSYYMLYISIKGFKSFASSPPDTQCTLLSIDARLGSRIPFHTVYRHSLHRAFPLCKELACASSQRSLSMKFIPLLMEPIISKPTNMPPLNQMPQWKSFKTLAVHNE
jgi:hypothetical protein